MPDVSLQYIYRITTRSTGEIQISEVDATAVTKTSNYTVTGDDYNLLGDASGGAFAFNLPPVANVPGCFFILSKSDSSANAVTVTPDGTEKINGLSSVLLSSQYDNITIFAGASGWEIIGFGTPASISNLKKGAAQVIFDGQGSVITVNNYVEIEVPYSGTITDWVIRSINPADGTLLSGSIVVDIKRSGASIIGGGNKPTLSSTSSNSAAVSGWTSVAVTAGDILAFYVVSATTVVKVLTAINITKS